MKTQVITLQTPRGDRINVTRKQSAILDAQGTLYAPGGQPYCDVHRGLHYGSVSYTDAQISEMIAAAQDSSFPGRIYEHSVTAEQFA